MGILWPSIEFGAVYVLLLKLNLDVCFQIMSTTPVFLKGHFLRGRELPAGSKGRKGETRGVPLPPDKAEQRQGDRGAATRNPRPGAGALAERQPETSWNLQR